MRNLAKVLMMAMVVLAGASTASAKTMTVGGAAETLFDAEQTAKDTGKNVTVTVRVVGKKWKTYNAVSKSFEKKILDGVENQGFLKEWKAYYSFADADFFTTEGKGINKQVCRSVSAKKGVVTIKATFSGKKCRKAASELKYLLMNFREFEERIQAEQPQTQREIAWFCAKFVSEHMINSGNRDYSEKLFYQKKAGGQCEGLANKICAYMRYAGVKKYGVVGSDKANHAWNYVVENGTKYFFEADDARDLVYGYGDDYADLVNVTSEDDLQNVYVIVDKETISTWNEVRSAGSEANYYVMNRERWIKHHSDLNKGDWKFKSWE
jgi:hypothetical protein